MHLGNGAQVMCQKETNSIVITLSELCLSFGCETAEIHLKLSKIITTLLYFPLLRAFVFIALSSPCCGRSCVMSCLRAMLGQEEWLILYFD